MARKSSCDSCNRLRAQLRAQQAQIDACGDVAELQERLARAQKNSSTSSKPPSLRSGQAATTATARRPSQAFDGGQPGHPRHERPPFGREMLNGARIPMWPKSVRLRPWLEAVAGSRGWCSKSTSTWYRCTSRSIGRWRLVSAVPEDALRGPPPTLVDAAARAA